MATYRLTWNFNKNFHQSLTPIPFHSISTAHHSVRSIYLIFISLEICFKYIEPLTRIIIEIIQIKHTFTYIILNPPFFYNKKKSMTIQFNPIPSTYPLQYKYIFILKTTTYYNNSRPSTYEINNTQFQQLPSPQFQHPLPISMINIQASPSIPL